MVGVLVMMTFCTLLGEMVGWVHIGNGIVMVEVQRWRKVMTPMLVLCNSWLLM
jgi:hypothetical protein